MPSWPSSNKAVTTALDSQNDDPNQARPEIKKNVDNVNDIIDFINPTSLADGDILQYVNANTRFENKTLASAGIEKTVLLTLATNTGQGSVNFYRFSELSDPYNLATIDSDGKLLLATGTYTIQGGAMIDQRNYDSHPFFTKDGSASELIDRLLNMDRNSPATERQVTAIISMVEKLEMPIEQALEAVRTESIETITKSDASILIGNLKKTINSKRRSKK